jgi:hypothetical protein
MPLFVWIAIAIALLLIGAGAGTGMLASPFVTALNGPLGYIVAIAGVVVVGIVVWKKKQN